MQTIWNGIALPGVFAILTPLLGTYPVIQQTVDNFAKVVDAVGTSLLGVGLSVLGPVQAVVNQFGSDTQAFADAIGKGDLGTAVSAIVNMPATLTNALLNGTPGTPGLLTPGTNAFDSGPIGALLRLRDTIAQALRTERQGGHLGRVQHRGRSVDYGQDGGRIGRRHAKGAPRHRHCGCQAEECTGLCDEGNPGHACLVRYRRSQVGVGNDLMAPADSSTTPNGEADKGTDSSASSTKTVSGTKDSAASDSGSAGHDAAGATGKHREKAAGADSTPKNGSESANKHTSDEHGSGGGSAKSTIAFRRD